MLAMENPVCEERFYFDEWKPSVERQHASPPVSEMDESWRRLSSGSFDEQNVWTPPTSTIDTRFTTQSSKVEDTAVSWKEKPVEQWSADEVTLWICSLMNNQPRSPFENNSYSPAAVNVAAYLNLTGADLIHMSSADMRARDPQSGTFVFMSLQSHLANTTSVYNTNTSTILPTYTHNMEPIRTTADIHPHMGMHESIKQEPVMTKDFAQPRLPSLDLKFISFDVDDRFESIQSLTKDFNAEKFVKNLHGQLPDLKPSPHIRAHVFNQHMQQFNMPPNNAGVWNDCQSHSPLSSSPLLSPGSDGSVTAPEDLSRDFCGVHYQYNEVKGNHLWEFIRDLLFDSRYNPSLVKWEDREDGIFKFVKSDQVAKLWGKKKNNPAMTYEKLSRAMRYYYKRKILERIDGRRLVYKFGSMATGWKA